MPLRIAALLMLLLIPAGTPAQAGDPAPAGPTFLGVGIEPDPGTILIIRDRLRVRAKPGPGGNRVGRLRKGDRVRSAGQATGANWVAVYGRDGAEYGFVYGPATRRLIDGRLDGNLEGRVAAGGGDCTYEIVFAGRQSDPREMLETADYHVDFTCARRGSTAEFSVYMFMTEIDYRLSANQRYQISVDAPEIAQGYEQVLSVTTLYRRRDDLVSFHSSTIPEFAAPPAVDDLPAPSVAAALKAAVTMAAAAWTERTWDILTGRAAPPVPLPADPDEDEKRE